MVYDSFFKHIVFGQLFAFLLLFLLFLFGICLINVPSSSPLIVSLRNVFLVECDPILDGCKFLQCFCIDFSPSLVLCLCQLASFNQMRDEQDADVLPIEIVLQAFKYFRRKGQNGRFLFLVQVKVLLALPCKWLALDFVVCVFAHLYVFLAEI